MAVNEADLSAQTASDYVQFVMLHCGLGGHFGSC